MSRDPSLKALRDASPRNQPGFDQSIAGYYPLRRQIKDAPVRLDRRPVSHRASGRRLVGISIAATAVAALAAVIVALTASVSAPASALAAARNALAATTAARSGTMTVTAVQGGSTVTLETTRWNGGDIAFSSSDGILGPNRQLLLIEGGVYVQQRDGRWLHYADENKVGQLGVAVRFAHANVAGNGAQRLLALAHNIKRTAEADGITVYTGTIPTTNPVQIGNSPANDAILRLVNNLRGNGNPPVSANPFDRHPAHYSDLQLKMTVASDGLVKAISLTVRPTVGSSSHHVAASTSRVTYTQLGDTPPITPPSKSMTRPPVSFSPGPTCPPPPHGPCGG